MSKDAEAAESGHSRGLAARVTMRDGTVRQARIEGVGCTAALCSRTAIKGASSGNTIVATWFDSLAAIRETTPGDAVFVLKDGATRRLSLLPGSRVLYIEGPFGASDRVDLADVRSLDAISAQ